MTTELLEQINHKGTWCPYRELLFCQEGYCSECAIPKPIKVVQIAGAFRANTQWGIMQNVRKAEDASLKLWKLGYAVICPHTMTQHFQNECPDEVWLDGCLELLKRADAIYLVDGWLNSEGSLAEYKLAREMGLVVMGDSDKKEIVK